MIKLNRKEEKEFEMLSKKWACMKATSREIDRHNELSRRRKPHDLNGHTWEFIPYAAGLKVGSWRCSTCLTAYEIGCGRELQCDQGASIRKIQKPTT